MAPKPIAAQKIVRSPVKRVEAPEPDVPKQSAPAAARNRPPKKVEEAEREAARGDDLDGSSSAAAGGSATGGSARFDAAVGREAATNVSSFVDRNARPGAARADAQSLVDEARAEVAAARAGRSSAAEELVGGSAGATRGTGDTAATDGKTSIQEMGKGGVSADADDSPPEPELAPIEWTQAELDAKESERLFEEELAKDDAEDAPKGGAGGGASRPLPDGDRFDPDSRGGQVAERLRASMAPRGGGGDGHTDPVDTGGLGQVVAGATLTDAKGTLLGGDTRGVAGEGGAGGVIPDRDFGRIDPAEGEDVGGGAGRDSDPFDKAPDAALGLDAARPTGQDDSDDGGDDGGDDADGGGLGAAVLAQRSVLAVQPVSRIDLSSTDTADDEPDDEPADDADDEANPTG